MLEVGLYQQMKADTGVSGFVSGRIFSTLMPKNPTYPVIVYNTVTTTDLGYHSQGASGLRMKRIQFDAYAKDHYTTISVCDALRTLFQSFRGVLNDGTNVQGCIVQGEMDFPYEEGGTGYIFRHMVEIDVIYQDNES